MNRKHHWIESYSSPAKSGLQPVDFITFLILVILITITSVIITIAFSHSEADANHFQSTACMVFGEIPGHRTIDGYPVHETQAVDYFWGGGVECRCKGERSLKHQGHDKHILSKREPITCLPAGVASGPLQSFMKTKSASGRK